MRNLDTVLGPMRVPFLVLAPVCVFLGISAVLWTEGSVRVLDVLLAIVGGVAAHISVNSLNEYFDFTSGLDLRTQRTPFSGGSGTLPAHPGAAPVALWTGILTAAVTAAIGAYFAVTRGWGIIPLGVLGLAIIFVYTVWLNRIPFLTLVSPGLGFGTLMVLGTCFALSGHLTWTAFFASLIPFFLVSNLLLLNQFPDVEADRSIGRRHYPITIGRRKSAVIYGVFVLLTFVAILCGVILGVMPAFTLLGLGALVLAVPTVRGVYQNADRIDRLIPFMGQNVILNLLTPVLVGVGFLIGMAF